MRQRESTPRLLQALRDAWALPDLRGKLIFTAVMLIIFRFVAHIPVPGVDATKMADIFNTTPLLGMLDMFSGGAMRNFSIAAMGVYPYITASIVMTLLVPIIPRLREISAEGESGRHKINLYTHWLTVPLAALQGYTQYIVLRNQYQAVSVTDTLGIAAIVVSMTAGTMFLVWLGELITERGIGNGVSIIIFGGIVANLPTQIGQGILTSEGGNYLNLIVFVIFVVVLVWLIVVFTEGHRRIPVQYAKAIFRGDRMYRQAGATHVPLRVNTAGMIPLIFAMSLMLFPGTIATYFQAPAGQPPNFANTLVDWFNPNASMPIGLFYWVLYFLLTVAFAFFYTMVIFEQMNIAKTLQQQGGFIPGVRPGKPTTEYLNRVINRITWGGALFLAIVAVSPFIVSQATTIQALQLSSTAVLIIVGVALDTMKQIEAQLTMRRYEGFLK